MGGKFYIISACSQEPLPLTVAAALVMAAAFYLVQIKAGVLSCLPGGVRAVGFSVYALVGVILTLVYSGFGKVVLSAGAK